MIRHQEPGAIRWQEEVARDPGNPAFVPLADLYRVQGRLDVARRVCQRGLARNPENVEGHYLLGRIYRDDDDPEKAYDEWDIALRLDPSDTASRRAIAFLCLERGDYSEAEKHLRRALENDPHDPRIRRALRFIERGATRSAPQPGFLDAVGRLLARRVAVFARESRARLVLVMDPSGRVFTQHGFTRELELAAFATLAAGVQSASAEIARMLGQPAFTQLYQGRGENQLFIGATDTPAGEILLLAVFGEDTTIGLVRALFMELARALPDAEWPEPAGSREIPDLEADLSAGLERAGVGASSGAGRAG